MNHSVAQRIVLMLSVALLSLIAVGSVGLWQMGSAQDRFEFVQENVVPSVKLLDEILLAVERNRIATRDHMLAGTEQDKKAAAGRVDQFFKVIEQDLATYEKELLADDADKALLAVDKKAYAAYVPKVKAVLDASSANDIRKAVELQKGISSELIAAMGAHIEHNWKLSEERRQENSHDYARGWWILLGVILFALTASVGLGWRTIHEIRLRMNRLSGLMNQVNETLDFTTRIKVTRLDELGHSADAFNKLLDKLQGSLKTIAQSTVAVAQSAEGMATTSEQVAKASHLQSESASDMAATVEQMTVSINHVADRAQETSRLTKESGQLAVDGERIIGQTAAEIRDIASTVDVAAAKIRELAEQGQQISNVVQVIKDVAEQTNLLALNAAIEAARAGEQGRGFAVVADEVRKLAERTSVSTQEISATIEAMRNGAASAVASIGTVVSKVDEGVAHATQANSAILQIGEGSRRAVAMVEEIAEAIREQGTATNNIAGQVERIAQMSEESSAAASNSSEAANKLDRLAKEMHTIVSTYRIDSRS